MEAAKTPTKEEDTASSEETDAPTATDQSESESAVVEDETNDKKGEEAKEDDGKD